MAPSPSERHKIDSNAQLWIEKIRDGDTRAFENLFLEFYAPLCRFAWQYVRDNSIAEEIVQDVFLKLWQTRENWEPRGSIRSYLYIAVKNRALDIIKHKKIEDNYIVEQIQSSNNKGQAVDDILHEKEFYKEAQKAITQLPERCRLVYILHRRDELSYNEIAEILDISVKTVESQMSRALRMLRKHLSHYLPLVLISNLFC